MEIEKFNGKLGKLIQASKGAYMTFEPNHLPLEIKYDEELIHLLAEAIESLSRLNGVSGRLQNPHLLIAPYLRKEAVLSSEIEGTRTSLSEVLLDERERIKKPDEDLTEVNNYIKALEEGLKKIKESSISIDLLKQLHFILMQSVRGEDKEPGKFKSHQNHIGGDLDIFTAKFVPASPETTPSLMENLIEYLNNSKKSTNLIKAGIMHYQFETIHPFRDGNGRIGRLLITLFLCKSGVLPQPLLYLSAYLKKHQKEYNRRLFEVSSKGEIENWLKFFLKAVKVQGDEAIDKTNQLENYRESARKILEKKSNSTNALLVLDNLFVNPFIKITDIMEILNCRHPTAKNNLNILIKNGILQEYPPKEKIRDKLFYAPIIHNILELKDITLEIPR